MTPYYAPPGRAPRREPERAYVVWFTLKCHTTPRRRVAARITNTVSYFVCDRRHTHLVANANCDVIGLRLSRGFAFGVAHGDS